MADTTLHELCKGFGALLSRVKVRKVKANCGCRRIENGFMFSSQNLKIMENLSIIVPSFDFLAMLSTPNKI
jgi:hypothetical protein